MVSQAHKDAQETPVHKVCQVKMEREERVARVVVQDHKVHQAHQVHQVALDLLVLLVPQEHVVQLDLPDPL